MTRIRMGLLPGLLLALALAVAACSGGGGGKGNGVASLAGNDSATSTTHVGGDLAQAAVAYGRCLRQHGINLPDPTVDEHNIVMPSHTRALAESTKFKAAARACNRLLPNGGQPGPPDPQRLQAALAFARCLRQHGINVPDPRDGDDVQLPAGMGRNDPRLMAAEQACGQRGGVANEHAGDHRAGAAAPRPAPRSETLPPAGSCPGPSLRVPADPSGARVARSARRSPRGRSAAGPAAGRDVAEQPVLDLG